MTKRVCKCQRPLGLTEGITLFSHVENGVYCFIALTYLVVLLLIMTEDRTELNSALLPGYSDTLLVHL